MEMEMSHHTTTLRRRALPRFSLRGALDYLIELDRRHRAERQLRQLDDHLLRDMGLTRGDIDREFRTKPW